MTSIGFFFGAGAEVAYGLPQGPDFTRRTFLAKRSRLYEALREFYEKRPCPEYVGEYRSDFLFRENSATFRQIVWEAAERCLRELNGGKAPTGWDPETRELLEYWHPDGEKDKKIREAFAEQAIKVYQTIVRDYDTVVADGPGESTASTSEPYGVLQKHFSYYGSVEKDFATIIDPDKNPVRFWRLINYFWSAFFSILLPILDAYPGCGDNEEYREDKYRYVLHHLPCLLETLYSGQIMREYRFTVDQEDALLDYYRLIREALASKGRAVDYVLTTNYTPFARRIWGEQMTGNECIAYLAGELRLFEYPQRLVIHPLWEPKGEVAEFMFPYLSTQAPVKPIIESGQIRQYAKALSFLDSLDILVVLGYGIQDEDHHIRALLREFASDPAKQLVYLQYTKKEWATPTEQEIQLGVCRKLRLDGHCPTIRGEVLEKNEREFQRQILRVCRGDIS